MSGWIVAFGEIAGLRWVLAQNRMAFSEGLTTRASRLEPGDELVLYVTRGAFHNPTRDRSQLGGIATVVSPLRRMQRPVRVAGRQFVAACHIDVRTVLPERGGVDFKPLIPRMSFIRNKEVWGQYLRAGLVPIPDQDLRILRDAIHRSPTR